MKLIYTNLAFLSSLDSVFLLQLNPMTTITYIFLSSSLFFNQNFFRQVSQKQACHSLFPPFPTSTPQLCNHRQVSFLTSGPVPSQVEVVTIHPSGSRKLELATWDSFQDLKSNSAFWHLLQRVPCVHPVSSPPPCLQWPFMSLAALVNLHLPSFSAPP